jgi:hypothetical protein
VPETPEDIRRARGRVAGATTWDHIKKTPESAERLARARRELAEAQAARLRREADALLAAVGGDKSDEVKS